MTTLKTKQDFMRALDALILRLCAGEKCINESHICSRINRHDANTYSYSEIRRGLDRLLEKGLIQKLNVVGDVWHFLNEKEPEVKLPVPKQRLETESKQFMKFEPKRKNQWTSMTELVVLSLIKQELSNVQIIDYLKQNHDFNITAKRLAWRIVLMRRAGLLKLTARNKTKTQWKHEEILELIRLREIGFEFAVVAAMLTEKFNREITYSAAASKYQEYLRYKRRQANDETFDNFRSLGGIAQKVVSDLAVRCE